MIFTVESKYVVILKLYSSVAPFPTHPPNKISVTTIPVSYCMRPVLTGWGSLPSKRSTPLGCGLTQATATAAAQQLIPNLADRHMGPE